MQVTIDRKTGQVTARTPTKPKSIDYTPLAAALAERILKEDKK